MSSLQDRKDRLESLLAEHSGEVVEIVDVRRGRKSGKGGKSGKKNDSSASSTPMAPPEITIETVKKVAPLFLNALCRLARVDECSGEEIDMFAEGSAPFFNMHLSPWIRENSVNATFIVACAMIAAPRIPQAVDAWTTGSEEEIVEETGNVETF